MAMSPETFVSFARLGLAPLVLIGGIYNSEIFYSSILGRLGLNSAVVALAALSIAPQPTSAPASNYARAFLASWTIIWSTVLTIVHNPSKDYKRIHKSCAASTAKSSGDSYEWQTFPKKSADRLFWAADLVFNFRRIGWQDIFNRKRQRNEETAFAVYKRLEVQESSSSTVLTLQAYQLIIDYLLMDGSAIALKNLYRLTPSSTSILLKYFPAAVFSGVTDAVHLFFGLVAAYAMIDMGHAALKTFCVCVLGPGLMGAAGEPWNYPSLWGTADDFFRGGLIGLWGRFWQNLFKYGMTELADFVIPSFIRDKGLRLLLRYSLVFGLSGLVHAGASYSLGPKATPFVIYLIFNLQTIGVLIQATLDHVLKPRPTIGNSIIKFALTAAWLTATFMPLVKDLERGGVLEEQIVKWSVLEHAPELINRLGGSSRLLSQIRASKMVI